MQKKIKAEIICVGTELLLGDIINTNAPYLSQKLAVLGINQYQQSVVGDNADRLKLKLSDSLANSDIVITSGGLGPTYDDLTKEVVADLLGKKLVMDSQALENIENIFKRRNVEMTDNNKKQALVPEGAVVFYNTKGTAPGIAVETDEGKCVIMLPGPPREFEPMVDLSVVPFLMKYSNGTIFSKTIHVFGMGESTIEANLYHWMTTSKNPTIAPYAKNSETQIRITATGDHVEECKVLCDDMIQRIAQTNVGKYIYGVDVGSLENALVHQLKDTGLTISTAESCTGGLISKRITDISGSSDVYFGGVIAYSNEIKVKFLNVSQQTLDTYGAVSEETALEMACGIREKCHTDIGISATGIAGPGGGTSEKPVGLIYLAVSSQAYTQVFKLLTANYDRESNRWRASSHALSLALSAVKHMKNI